MCIHSPPHRWGWVDAHPSETPENQQSPTPAGKRSEFCFLIESLALSPAAYELRNSDPPSHYKDTQNMSKCKKWVLEQSHKVNSLDRFQRIFNCP